MLTSSSTAIRIRHSWGRRVVAAARCLVVCGASPVLAGGVLLFVKTLANGGDNANDGLTWATAKATVSAAIALASADGTQINVAAGTYNEKVAFPQLDNVQMFGGWPAAGVVDGAAPAGLIRDPANNPTILDGTGLASAAMINIPVAPGGVDGFEGIIVDGFTLQNGVNSTFGAAGIESASGGVTFRNLIIQNCTGSAAFTGVGGIHLFMPQDAPGQPRIENCIIRNNNGTKVGGIELEGALGRQFPYTARLINNVIAFNRATATGAPFNFTTGGVDIFYPANVLITNNTIAFNTSVEWNPASSL